MQATRPCNSSFTGRSACRPSAAELRQAVMAPAAADVLSCPVDQSAGPLPAILPPPLRQDALEHKLKSTRQGSVEPYTLVEGPGAWYGNDFQGRESEWALHLTQRHIDELDSAVKRVLGNKTVTQDGNYLNLKDEVTKDDFPLPTLGPLLKDVQQEVLRGRGFALLKGLPVERWSRKETLIAYWGIGLHWGRPMRQNQKAHLIGHHVRIRMAMATLQDVGIDSKHRNPVTRIYLTSVAQPWHVDGVDVVGLLCLKTAKSGGLSSFASSVTVHNELLKREPELVRVLAGTWYMDRKNEVPHGKLPYYVLPVVHYHKGHLATSFNDTYYQLAASRHPEVPALTAEQERALQRFREIATEVSISMWLEPGDLQLLHKPHHRHNRSGYDDYEEINKKRHLLRLWLAPSAEDGAFPLHPSFAELWDSVEPGQRGGIHIDGFKECIPLEAEAGNLLNQLAT